MTPRCTYEGPRMWHDIELHTDHLGSSHRVKICHLLTKGDKVSHIIYNLFQRHFEGNLFSFKMIAWMLKYLHCKKIVSHDITFFQNSFDYHLQSHVSHGFCKSTKYSIFISIHKRRTITLFYHKMSVRVLEYLALTSWT